MMKKLTAVIVLILLILSTINAQYYKLIIVPSGTKVIEKFPPSLRYFYPAFTAGHFIQKNGISNSGIFNLNVLTGEIEFIQDNDTLAIARKRDVNMVIIARDTFIYRNEYLRKIHSVEPVILEKDAINLKEIVRKGAMGQPSRTSAVDSYGSMNYKSNSYLINPDADMEFRRELEFFILKSDGEIVELRKKTLPDLYPGKESEIQKFLKANKIKFEERDDIIKLADFLATL